MSNQNEITFSIGETEKLTGASQKQIRYWEKNGLISRLERNVCGDIAYRQFTQNHVELIRASPIICETLELSNPIRPVDIWGHID